MRASVIRAAEGFDRRAFSVDAAARHAFIQTGVNDETWAHIAECGPSDVLSHPELPGFALRLGDV